jgi:hypothetical protein
MLSTGKLLAQTNQDIKESIGIVRVADGGQE